MDEGGLADGRTSEQAVSQTVTLAPLELLIYMQFRAHTTKSWKGIAKQKVRSKGGGAEGGLHELYIQPPIRGALAYL